MSEVYRKCDQDGCEFPAVFYLVWIRPQYYCLEHANKMLQVGEAMGHPTPRATLRKLTIDEMLPEESDGKEA